MASTGNNRRGSTAVCRYFLANACRYGSGCIFSHDRSQSGGALNLNSNNVCVFYRSGSCSFGNNCRYSHDDSVQLNTFDVYRPPSAANSDSQTTVAQPEASSSNSRLRAEAAEFVPRSQQAVADSQDITSVSDVTSRLAQMTSSLMDEPNMVVLQSNTSKKKINMKYDALCPYFVKGNCWYAADVCQFVHGNPCDFCNEPALHPTDKKQRAEHIRQCSERFEREMDQAFADQASDRSKELSKEKQCGICMELVVDKKELSERRFGILPNCRHVFCLSCIRKWRCSRSFETNIIRACPECRTKSDFVVPSLIWADDEKEKSLLITHYKKQCKQKHCKYFKRGTTQSECPFGNQCFYRHEKPDGTIVEGDSPRTVRRRIQARQALTGTGRRRRRPSYVMWDFLTVDDDFEDLDWSWGDADEDWDTDSMLSLEGGMFEFETDISNIIDRIDHMDWSAMMRGQAAAIDLDIGYMGDDLSDAFSDNTDTSSIDWDATLAVLAAADESASNERTANAWRTRNRNQNQRLRQTGARGGAGSRNRRRAGASARGGANSSSRAAANASSSGNGASTSSTSARAGSRGASGFGPRNSDRNEPTSEITRWWNREVGGGSGRSSESSDNPWSFGAAALRDDERWSTAASGRSHSTNASGSARFRNQRHSTSGLSARHASNMSVTGTARGRGATGSSNSLARVGRSHSSHSGTPTRSMSGRRSHAEDVDAPDRFPMPHDSDMRGGLF